MCERVENWKLTGLLEGLTGQTEIETADNLETCKDFLLYKVGVDGKEKVELISNWMFPIIVRLCRDRNMFPIDMEILYTSLDTWIPTISGDDGEAAKKFVDNFGVV